MALNSTNPAADELIASLNVPLNLLATERDRLTQLTKGTLPLGSSVWDIVTPEGKDLLRAALTENILVAQKLLDVALSQIGNI